MNSASKLILLRRYPPQYLQSPIIYYIETSVIFVSQKPPYTLYEISIWNIQILMEIFKQQKLSNIFLLLSNQHFHRSLLYVVPASDSLWLPPSLQKYVREQILLAVAVIVKRGSLDKSINCKSIFHEVGQLISSGNPTAVSRARTRWPAAHQSRWPLSTETNGFILSHFCVRHMWNML